MISLIRAFFLIGAVVCGYLAGGWTEVRFFRGGIACFYYGANRFRNEMFFSAQVNRRKGLSGWPSIRVLLEFSLGAL